MHDQSPTILSSISKLEEGLKTYGLLKSIREQPLIWEPVFVSGSAPSLTATAFLNELLVDFSLSDVKKQKEIDVFYHFTNYIQSGTGTEPWPREDARSDRPQFSNYLRAP